jgi:hypothetical protein
MRGHNAHDISELGVGERRCVTSQIFIQAAGAGYRTADSPAHGRLAGERCDAGWHGESDGVEQLGDLRSRELDSSVDLIAPSGGSIVSQSTDAR